MKLVRCLCVSAVIVSACAIRDDEVATDESLVLQAAPADAEPVPADYDGDGFTDFALKGSNGIWYIDVAKCSGGRCLGPDGYGGRWDFAYAGYGDASAKPVPCDYGNSDGSVDTLKRADLAVKDASGMWAIDFADNGFGTWDVQKYYYGDTTWQPVPADYDGDGRCDMAVKTSGGNWYIDYASNGFNGWDPPNAGCPSCPQLSALYGPTSWIPVPADYNGDGRADLAVKTGTGEFRIDYSNTANTGFGSGIFVYAGYGDSTAVPVPANYDPQVDNKADLAIKSAAGEWMIDFAADGFGAWNMWPPPSGYGGSWSTAIPGNYDLSLNPAVPRQLDFSVKDSSGYWYTDLFAVGGYSGWNIIPGTSSTSIDNPNRPPYDAQYPYIWTTKIYQPEMDRNGDGAITQDDIREAFMINGQYQLEIGIRYTIAVQVVNGQLPVGGDVVLNPDLHVPAHLNILNPVVNTDTTILNGSNFPYGVHVRRFVITCTEWGSFPVGFMWNVGPNPDYGVRVACTSSKSGLHGVVTQRKRSPTGHYYPGPVIQGANVHVDGYTDVTTLSDGSWHMPAVTGGPHKVVVTKAATPSSPAFSSTTVVNVRVPSWPAGAGVKVDTPLEQDFSATLGLYGMLYSTYIDYSEGRTIFHTLRIERRTASLKIAKSETIGSGTSTVYRRLVDIAQSRNLPALINGGYFDGGGKLGADDDGAGVADDVAVGYVYGGSPPNYSPGIMQQIPLRFCGDFVNPNVSPCAPPGEPDVMYPMLAIAGTGTRQTISIFMTESDFKDATSTTWKQRTGVPGCPTTTCPVYDVSSPSGSDFSYAMQMEPWLVMNGSVFTTPAYDFHWPRTAVGTDGGNTIWYVIADGEGINGSNGASFTQLARLFRDHLGVTQALALDGGWSTEMVLRVPGTPATWRNVNTISGEDRSADCDRTIDWEVPEQCHGLGGVSPGGGIGSVYNYLTAGP